MYAPIFSFQLLNCIGSLKSLSFSFMNNKKDKNDWINDTYNANYGFINKETIYRVKKDER